MACTNEQFDSPNITSPAIEPLSTTQGFELVEGISISNRLVPLPTSAVNNLSVGLSVTTKMRTDYTHHEL